MVIDHPHPLDGTDRPIIEALGAVNPPSQLDIINAARLHIRYRDSRLSPDLLDQLLVAIQRWSLSTGELQERARAIWQSGWRPPLPGFVEEQPVGSGSDVEG
jgi:hypothetical protein